MADEYIDLGFPDQGDAELKRERGITALENGIDGYEHADGNPEVILLEGTAEMAADNETLAQQVALSIYRDFGINIVGFPAIDESAATALTTWTVADTTGYTITAGVQVAIGLVTFVLVDDLTIPSGSSSVSGVELASRETGDATSSLTDVPALITAIASPTVVSITLDQATFGGHDAEDDDVYAGRLRRRLQSIGRPELAEDFTERMSENPEVSATLVLDGYNADTTTSGNDATVTLVARNALGLPISTDAKAERLAAIQAEKVEGWDIFVIDPTYTTVAVAATITVWPGYDDTAVKASAAAAAASFLSPATWGSPESTDLVDWNLETLVLRSDVTAAIKDVIGVRHVTSVTLAVSQLVTASASTDVFTDTAHGYSNGDTIVFSGLTGGAPLVEGTTYYVRDVTTNTFKVAATSGGAAINITADITAGRVQHLANADVTLTGVAPLPLPGPAWIS